MEGAIFAAPAPSIYDLPFGHSEYSRIQTSSTMFGKRLVGTPESMTATDCGTSAFAYVESPERSKAPIEPVRRIFLMRSLVMYLLSTTI